MRTYEQINEEIAVAMSMSDAAALMRLATEMELLDTPLASATAHRSRGTACIMTGDDTGAIAEYSQALQIYKDLGSLANVARVLGNMGNVYTSTGVFAEALEHYQRALEIYEDLEDLAGIATVTGNMGNVHQYTGSYPTALDHYHCALEAHEQLGNQYGVAIVTSNIGNVFSITGAHGDALAWYERARALHEQLGDRDGVAVVTNNMGNVYSIMKQYSKAIECFDAAMKIHTELGHTVGVALATGNKIAALLDQQQYDAASAMLDERSGASLNDPTVRALAFQNTARLREHDGDLAATEACLNQALRIVSEAGMRDGEAQIQRRLRDLAQARNDFGSYIKHNDAYQRITEEIKGRETTQRLAIMEVERRMAEERRQRDRERAILYSTLPKDIANRVVRGERVSGDHYDMACVIFLDIVDFTSIADALPPVHVVQLLDTMFTMLDKVVDRHGVTKIKTIGDSYMAVSFANAEGQTPNTGHIVSAARCAVEMLSALRSLDITTPMGINEINVRIGIHCGPVTAGIIGTERLQYDVWGDTVNVASRMEHIGEPGRIHVSEAFATALQSVDGGQWTVDAVNDSMTNDSMTLFKRGEVSIKGKGPMTTYWLEGA